MNSMDSKFQPSKHCQLTRESLQLVSYMRGIEESIAQAAGIPFASFRLRPSVKSRGLRVMMKDTGEA
jgi:hypothetical protein